MTLTLHEIVLEETKKLVPVLLDADEDEYRIRRALANEVNTTYAAQEGDEYVGAVTVKWEGHESELFYFAVIRELRGCGYGKKLSAWDSKGRFYHLKLKNFKAKEVLCLG